MCPQMFVWYYIDYSRNLVRKQRTTSPQKKTGSVGEKRASQSRGVDGIRGKLDNYGVTIR